MFIIFPSILFVVMRCSNKWFRTKVIQILVIWCLLPILCQQLGITHQSLFKIFGDSWFTYY
jgi:hypothetical protein